MTDLSQMTSGGDSQAADPASPLMVAWKQFTQSESYANSKKWAAFPEHVEGSLWALFQIGWRAGSANERHRCVAVIEKAREGEIDTDLRAIKAHIQNPD